ncbi:MAG: hypothetical protein QM831_36490 [Kofleriaceae bacterium]
MMMRVAVTLMCLAGVTRADSYTVDGDHDFHAKVTFERDTGTTHEATNVTLSVGDAKVVRFGGDQLPLIEKAIQLAPDRWLAIGWSSYGSGMETMSAWIVQRKKDALKIIDELYWTSDRTSAGFAIEDDKGTLRIGIPQQTGTAHDPDEWKLVIGAKTIDVTKLRYAKVSTTLFAPPMPDKPCACALTWVAATTAFAPAYR